MKKHYVLAWFYHIVFIGIYILFVGCTKNSKNENITFFGGKIKNPKSEYVYFYQGEKILDSAKLNAQSKFSFYFDSLKEGLYTFKTGDEFQYLYLEPQDSLLLYLNTWDFDESIIFSGKGEAKNNFLINLFLQQEKNEKYFKHNYIYSEVEFTKAIDVETGKLLHAYNELIEKEGKKPSDFFNKLAKVGIYYPFYYFKEYYPFRHKMALKLKSFPTLSENFYAFREKIDLNDESLLSYGPYPTYIKTYLYHLAFIEKENNPEKGCLELNFMKIVNDKIQIESVKNDFLAGVVWKSLSQTGIDRQDMNKIKEFFFEYCTDEKIISQIQRSMYQKEKLKSGEPLPNIVVTNSNGNELIINDYTKNQLTVIFFWPKNLAQIEMANNNLINLEKQFPNIQFLGIERNKTSEEWVTFIQSKKLRKENQFKLSNNSENHDLFDNEIALTILVNRNGNIENGFLSFNDKYFDKHLKNLINSNL